MSKVNRWFISDLHLSHHSTINTFVNDDGSPLRPFKNVEEMNQKIIDNWNNKIKDNDLVYVLGDLCMGRKQIGLTSALRGRKRLIGGNHDFGSIEDYVAAGWEKIYGVKVFNGDFICSHIPVREDNLTRFIGNLHGHLHSHHINDPRYLNVSVEQVNYTPLSFEEVQDRFKKNKESYEISKKVIDWCKVTRGIEKV
jgi:calcineurin-like phosphoesterase family protein